MREFVIFAQLM